MVEFGVPLSNDRQREEALKCAIAIQESSPLLQEKLKKLGLDWKLEFGIGFNTGEAALGNVGTLRRMEYTALGDAVNTAFRIEGLRRRLNERILVGENTFSKNVKSILDEGCLANLRGKTEPVKVYATRT
jgi:adenylate cyclase